MISHSCSETGFQEPPGGTHCHITFPRSDQGHGGCCGSVSDQLQGPDCYCRARTGNTLYIWRELSPRLGAENVAHGSVSQQLQLLETQFQDDTGEINALLKLRNKLYSRIGLICSICVHTFHCGSRNDEPLAKSESPASPWMLGSSLCPSRSFWDEHALLFFQLRKAQTMFAADNTWILPREVNLTSWFCFLMFY